MVMALLGFYDLVTQCAPNVGVSTIAAIVKTESSFDPLAINVNVKKNTPKPKINPPKNQNEAIATAKWLLANHYNIDMGLGQINSSNLSGLGLTVDEMFNPCSNLNAAGIILKGNYQTAIKETSNEQDALYAAISAYNTGSLTKGFSNGYVNSVVSNAPTAFANVDIQVPELIKSDKPDVNNEIIPNKTSEPVTQLTAPTATATATLAEQPTPSSKQEESIESEVMVYDGSKEDLSNKVMVY